MTDKTTAAPKTKGPDNNKRLGELEAGVSALALALTTNGISLEQGVDPIEAAIGAIKTVAELREQVETLNAEVEQLTAKVAELEASTILNQLVGYASATIGRIAPDLDLAPLTDEAPFDYLDRLTLAANPKIDQIVAAAKIQAAGESGDATAGEIAAIARAEAAEKLVVALEMEVADLQVDVEELASAKNALANQLADDGKGTAPPAIVEEQPEPEPELLVRAEGARDVPADLPSLTHVAIGALVNDGGPFEIVFSNGEYELVEFGSPPIEIPAADLLRVDGSRYIVGKAINIRGGQAPARIVGAALFYRGEQVAFCAFEPAAVIQPGQERRFDRALIF